MTKLLIEAFHFGESDSAKPSAPPALYVTLRTIFVATGPWIPMRTSIFFGRHYYKDEVEVDYLPAGLLLLLGENCETFKFTLKLSPLLDNSDVLEPVYPQLQQRIASILKYSCPQLQNLDFSGLADEFYVPLISEILCADDHRLCSIESIEFPYDWRERCSIAIQNMRQTMPNLRSLIFPGENSSYPAICDELSKMTNLTHLEIKLSYRTFTDECMLKLSPLVNLRKVDFRFNSLLTSKSGTCFQNMSRLQSLNLCQVVQVLGKDFDVLDHLPHLTELLLKGKGGRDFELTTSRLRSIVECCLWLQSLRLSTSVLKFDSEKDLSLLSQLRYLTDLDFSSVELSDDDIRAVGRCRNLRRLDVNDTRGSYTADAFVSELAKLEKLEAIHYVESPNMSDETFRLYLDSKSAALRNIEDLRIFSAHTVTDLAFSKYIIHLSNVKHITVKQSSLITDDSVRLVLENLPKLLSVMFRRLSKLTKRSLEYVLERIQRDAAAVLKGKKSALDCLGDFSLLNCGTSVDDGDEKASTEDAKELLEKIQKMNLSWNPIVEVVN